MSPMNFQQSKALLKKINALHDSASAFDMSVSKMERDLLLHYLRELYEVVSDDTVKVSSAAPESTPAPEPVEYRSAPTVAPVREAVRQSTPAAPERQYTPAPAPRHEAPITPPAPVTIPAYSAPHPTPQPVQPVVTPSPPPAPVKEEVDEALSSLFEMNDSNDVSSRFSRLPISDISKSMGINDKILTINELFKGNQHHFNEVVSKLNTFSKFEEAKDFLIAGVAKENNWGKGSKRGKAETFIKLIKRRYL